MATPEKAIAIIPAPACSALWNELLGLLTVVLECEWFKAVSMLTTLNIQYITMNMCSVYDKRKKHFLAVCVTLKQQNDSWP